MPSRKNADDTYRDIVHPINSEFRALLENAVKAAYDAELESLANAEETV
jgi:DNA-binding cell septation regulator SpoVG